LEDLFLGSQWSIILGYIWLSVKFFLRLEVRQITKDKISKRMIGKGLTVPWKIEHFLADSSKLIEEKEND